MLASVNISALRIHLVAIKTSTKTFASNPIIIFKFASFELFTFFFSPSQVFSALRQGESFSHPLYVIFLIDKHGDLETINFEGFRVGFNSFFPCHTTYELLDM